MPSPISLSAKPRTGSFSAARRPKLRWNSVRGTGRVLARRQREACRLPVGTEVPSSTVNDCAACYLNRAKPRLQVLTKIKNGSGLAEENHLRSGLGGNRISFIFRSLKAFRVAYHG